MANEEEKRRIKRLFNCKDLLMTKMEIVKLFIREDLLMEEVRRRLSMKEVATVELSGGESEQPLFQQLSSATVPYVKQSRTITSLSTSTSSSC